jgi:hypothetical protein
LQESAEDGASVSAQLAEVFYLMRPADGGWLTPVTAADVGSVIAEEMAAWLKVLCCWVFVFRVHTGTCRTWPCVPAATVPQRKGSCQRHAEAPHEGCNIDVFQKR